MLLPAEKSVGNFSNRQQNRRSPAASHRFSIFAYRFFGRGEGLDGASGAIVAESREEVEKSIYEVFHAGDLISALPLVSGAC